MGGTKQYEKYGEIREPEYKQVGVTSNGIKVLQGLNKNSSGLPRYAHTPFTMYATTDSNTNELKQISGYGGKSGLVKIKDLDWSHPHEEFKKGDIHVHIYENGIKTKKYRKASRKERRIVYMARNGR